MKKFNIIITILGLFIGLLGLFTPILWDKYINNSEITVNLEVFNDILGKNTPDGLIVSYKERKVKELYHISFVIKNTGKKPIKGEDFISPIKIFLNDYNAILEVRIGEKTPKDMNVTLKYNEKNGEILSKSVLLNPSDQYSISILTESKNLNFKAMGRITGVKNIITKKNSNIKVEAEKPSKKFVSGVMLFSLIASLFWGQGYLREVYVKYLLKKGEFEIPKGMNRWATRSYLSRKFSFLESEQDKFSLLQSLDQMQESPDFSEKNFEAIILEIEKLMSRTGTLMGYCLFSLLFASISSICYVLFY